MSPFTCSQVMLEGFRNVLDLIRIRVFQSRDTH